MNIKDLLDKKISDNIVNNFKKLLSSIVENPDERVCNLDYLATQEKKLLTVFLNKTKTDYSKQICIHHFFSEQVSKNPTATAFIYENQYITYEQLDNYSNKLANL